MKVYRVFSYRRSYYFISLLILMNFDTLFRFHTLFRRIHHSMPIDGIIYIRNGNRGIIAVQITDKLVHDGIISAAVTAVIIICANVFGNVYNLFHTSEITFASIDCAKRKLAFFHESFNFPLRPANMD